jgi:DNA helicase HerA-like ATPase
MSTQLDHERYLLGVFGGSGTGKTTYAAKFLANTTARCRFIFDPEGDFCQLMHLLPARTTFEIDQATHTGFVAFDPHTMFPGELERALEFFSSYALQASKQIPGRKFFAVDELGRYTSGHDVPAPLKTIVQSGRRFGLDSVFVAQQPNELHNTVRCQLSEVVCFQLIEERALEFPASFGFNAEEIRALAPRGEFICRNNRGQEFRSN